MAVKTAKCLIKRVELVDTEGWVTAWLQEKTCVVLEGLKTTYVTRILIAGYQEKGL